MGGCRGYQRPEVFHYANRAISRLWTFVYGSNKCRSRCLPRSRPDENVAKSLLTFLDTFTDIRYALFVSSDEEGIDNDGNYVSTNDFSSESEISDFDDNIPSPPPPSSPPIPQSPTLSHSPPPPHSPTPGLSPLSLPHPPLAARTPPPFILDREKFA